MHRGRLVRQHGWGGVKRRVQDLGCAKAEGDRSGAVGNFGADGSVFVQDERVGSSSDSSALCSLLAPLAQTPPPLSPAMPQAQGRVAKCQTKR